MKKISVILAMITLPAIAEEIGTIASQSGSVDASVASLYGTEPVESIMPLKNTASVENAVQAEYGVPASTEKIETAENILSTKNVESVKNIESVEKVVSTENVKSVKNVGHIENVEPVFVEETTIQDVPQTVHVKNYDESPRNPKTRFPHGLQIGVGVSPTSGLNGFVGYNNKNFDSFWAKRFGIRFDFASYSPIRNKMNTKINNSVGDDGIKVDDNLKIDNFALYAKHFGALIDFYPFGNTWFLGGLRISGGYMTGKLDLDADIVGKNIGGNIEFELDGHKYYYTGGEMRGTATLDWKYNGPYLGTGFDLGLFFGFKIYLDAGVVFANKSAKIDLNVPFEDLNLQDENGNIVGDTTNPLYDQVMEAYETAKAAELRDAQKELDKYPYYPLVKLGFMYRF